MSQLLLGMLLFFGAHCVSIVAPGFRDRMAGKSELGWKALYSIVSLLGLVMMVRGYGELRMTPQLLYVPPAWLRHVAAILLLPVFVFFLAPYFPGRIKTALKHPQLVAVKLWALGHLLANGMLADVILFGSFLAWAVAARISAKRRPARPLPGAPESRANDIIVTVLGLAVTAVMVLWLHARLFGVKPFA